MTPFDLVSFGLASHPGGQLFSFTLRHHRVHHEAFSEAVRKIALLHHRGKVARAPEGLLIYGQSGSGKSSVADYYQSKFPRYLDDDGYVIPVLLVMTPESPTVKSLSKTMLSALGDPASSHGTTAAQTHRLVTLVQRCKVELLLIDEFQHFAEGSLQEAKRVSEWLKNLLNLARIPVVLFGLPKSLPTLRRNGQLRRRFDSPHYFRPFEVEGKLFGDFKSLLRTLQKTLPLPCIDLASPEVGRRFFFASNGLIDYVIKILDKVVVLAQTRGEKAIDLDLLAEAFREAVWGEAPDQLNPFKGQGINRMLTERYEPFESWDDPQQYFRRAAHKPGDAK